MPTYTEGKCFSLSSEVNDTAAQRNAGHQRVLGFIKRLQQSSSPLNVLASLALHWTERRRRPLMRGRPRSASWRRCSHYVEGVCGFNQRWRCASGNHCSSNAASSLKDRRSARRCHASCMPPPVRASSHAVDPSLPAIITPANRGDSSEFHPLPPQPSIFHTDSLLSFRDSHTQDLEASRMTHTRTKKRRRDVTLPTETGTFVFLPLLPDFGLEKLLRYTLGRDSVYSADTLFTFIRSPLVPLDTLREWGID